MKCNRLLAWLVPVLWAMSCSGNGSSVFSGGMPAGGSGGSTNGGAGGSFGVGTGGVVDCSQAADKQGCACAASGEQRSCVAGVCQGTQACISSGNAEFVTLTWGACTASSPCVPPPPTSGSGGGGDGHGGTGGATGGRTGDGDGGKGGGTGDGLPPLCTDKTINNEPEILAAYSPPNGATIPESGQIRVWVNDEGAPFIAPNEQLDPNTGAIVMPGDRAAKAPDGYLWEPALYIAPATAERGGTPHFPQLIKGNYNYPGRGKNAGFTSAPIEPIPGNPSLQEKYTAEDVWQVSALGLSPGTYILEFVVWDGDTDRAVGCITVTITP